MRIMVMLPEDKKREDAEVNALILSVFMLFGEKQHFN